MKQATINHNLTLKLVVAVISGELSHSQDGGYLKEREYSLDEPNTLTGFTMKVSRALYKRDDGPSQMLYAVVVSKDGKTAYGLANQLEPAVDSARKRYRAGNINPISSYHLTLT